MKFEFENRQYKIVDKQSSDEPFIETSKYPQRSIQELFKKGIIILDKPSGPTSHQAVDFLKRILGLKKAGHSGTLDPGVTGVLPVALEESTRVTFPLLTAGKEYVCLIHFHSDEFDLEKIKSKFTGVITQLPPKKSAVKRAQRQRRIYYFEVLDIKSRDVLVKIGCQAGTYIRKLVHDIGIFSGSGAHMSELRRTRAGPFYEDKAVTLQDVADAFYLYKNGDESAIKNIILPLEEGISHLKKLWVYDSCIKSLCNGAYLKIPGIKKLDSDIDKNDDVAVLSSKGELILVGKANHNSNRLLKQSAGIAIVTSQVFKKN